jgi:hypothetical protein
MNSAPSQLASRAHEGKKHFCNPSHIKGIDYTQTTRPQEAATKQKHKEQKINAHGLHTRCALDEGSGAHL